jgi:hypothetical protein
MWMGNYSVLGPAKQHPGCLSLLRIAARSSGRWGHPSTAALVLRFVYPRHLLPKKWGWWGGRGLAGVFPGGAFRAPSQAKFRLVMLVNAVKACVLSSIFQQLPTQAWAWTSERQNLFPYFTALPAMDDEGH